MAFVSSELCNCHAAKKQVLSLEIGVARKHLDCFTRMVRDVTGKQESFALCPCVKKHTGIFFLTPKLCCSSPLEGVWTICTQYKPCSAALLRLDWSPLCLHQVWRCDSQAYLRSKWKVWWGQHIKISQSGGTAKSPIVLDIAHFFRTTIFEEPQITSNLYLFF